MNWQPITTAPKNTQVLVHCADGIEIAVFWTNACDVWVDHQGRMEAQPTHWMPLPAPPSAPEGGG